MILIVCVDDSGGMLFNGRRQSLDRKLAEFIMSKYKSVTCSSYSQPVFSDYMEKVFVKSKPDPEDIWFCESEDYAAYPEISELVVCRWNRVYPCDVKFVMDMSMFEKVSACEIAGYSHEKISIDIYRRRTDEK